MSPNVPRVTRGRAVALLAAGCALAAAATGTGPYLSSHAVPEQPLRRLIEAAARERQRQNAGGTDGPRPRTWIEVLVEVLLVAAVAAAVCWLLVQFVRQLVRLGALVLRRSRGGDDTTSYDPGEESYDDAVTELRKRVAAELGALSADLDALPEPREAVIACYVRMERAFAGAGSARRPDESPLELLARVLTELDVPEADVRRLTDLFAEARFSHHPVTDEMRAAARRSLAAVHDALAVGA